jgi:TorA maturation chaperone TorD
MDQTRDSMSQGDTRRVVDEIDHARAQEYALLATLLLGSPGGQMIEHLARLRGDATPLGGAHAALAEAAVRTNAETVKQEYFDLFAGLGGGGLLPYASYYLTGSLYGRPLARLRETLQSLGIEKAEGHSEPEDHAGILCGIMANLAGDHVMAPAEADHALFEEHLAPWIGHFFSDLERAESADFYARVGAVGRIFMDIETEAFTLAA